MLVTGSRAVEVDEPVNYRWVVGLGLSEVKADA
jgi:hypothetical protein